MLMTPSESKIMMLKRMTRRLQRRLQNEQLAAKNKDKLVELSQNSIVKLREQIRVLRSGGAKATPALDPDLIPCYEEGIRFFEANPYKQVFKDGQPAYFYKDDTRTVLVKWTLRVLAEGMYDLEYVSESKL